MFELVSGEDRAKMEAAKMQAEVSASQQQKQTPLASESAASGTACVDSRDPDISGAFIAVQTNATACSSATVSTSQRTFSNTTASPLLHQKSLHHAGFTPFAKNPAKQKRYEAYLQSLKAGTTCESASFVTWSVKILVRVLAFVQWDNF